MSLRAKLLITGLFLLTANLIYLGSTNYVGLCRDTWGYLPKQALIEIAVKYEARRIADLPDQPTIEQVRTYIANNPKCCAIDRAYTAYENGALDRLFGFYKTWVALVFKTKHSSSDKPPGYYEATVGILACGEAVTSSGSSLSDKEKDAWLNRLK